MTQRSIKETKEALAFAIVVTEIIAAELADGFQPLKDVSAAVNKLSTPENIAKLQAAVDGAPDIDDELKDTNLGEKFELLTLFLAAFRKIAG